jgi:hypothetical protein
MHMNTPQSDTSLHPAPLNEILTDAFRYWERRRILYNLVLTGVVVSYVLTIWPQFRAEFHWVLLLPLFVLAVLANVCYSAVYIVDVPVQYSAFRVTWRRWRWVLWLIGTLFAATLALFWLGDEIFPDIGS